MNRPTSRWRRSTVTFGPLGRVAWTVILFAIAIYPILVAVTYGYVWVCLYIGGIPLLVVLFPLAMRDVWRRVPNPDYEPPITLPPELEPVKPGDSVHDRKVPRRW